MSISELIFDTIFKGEPVTLGQNIFRYDVPENFHTKTDDPIIRITPLPYSPNEYADDNELTREYDVQIDVWWSQDEPHEQAELIVQKLKKINFKSYYREPLYEVETQTFREIIRASGSLFT